MNEANKKTPRTFQCRNGLWVTFEDMAKELECSVDYLINDAMKQYARQRGYAKELPSAALSLSPGGPPHPPGLSDLARTSVSMPPGGARHPGTSLPFPPTPNHGSGSHPHPLPAAPPPLPPGARIPGPPPAQPAPPHRPASPEPQSLTLHFEGQSVIVNKPRFIIGRGKASSDLTIRDPNVSRQHAVVEFAGGHYYIVDMGSTNGIEFRGQRVQRKAIQNGDVFRICDHDVFCSLG